MNEAADDLLTGMESGAVRTRSGDPYKPSTIRAYRESLDLHVRPDLGAMKLGDVQRRHVQRLVDELGANEKTDDEEKPKKRRSPSTIRNALMPLRVIYRRAIRDGLVVVNPCDRVELPASRRQRIEIVSPEDAASLIAALPELRDRTLWATAFYAGLRRGELMGLRWRDVDLASGVLHVERAYDPKADLFVAPKSEAGRRRVPIAAVLRTHLRELAIGSRRTDPDALVFADVDGRPFVYSSARKRAKEAWTNAKRDVVGLHYARHTFASLMIAAGVNAKALSEFMGHSSIQITLDRYGHLMPGSIAEATSLLDAYLERSTGTGTGTSEAKSLETSG